MILKSESDKRIIVQGTINGKKAYMLVDTGATVGMFHKKAAKTYKIVTNNHKVNLVGAGGAFTAYVSNTPFLLADKPIYQFVVSDISDVVKSIQRQTGIEIAGIIGLAQMKMMGISIDTDDNYVEIG